MQKLLILQTHPIQYYAPIYKALAEREALDIVAVYLTDAGAKTYFDPGFNRELTWDIDLLTGYRYRVLQPEASLHNLGFWRKYHSSLIKMLTDEQPDWILLYGYASRMNWVARWFAQRHNIRILYTSDSNIRIDFHNSPLYRYAKSLAIKWFFQGVDCFLSPSDANREYLIKYGALQTKIFWSPFAIDVKRFNNGAQQSDRSYTFIWAGKFVGLKRCIDYLNALVNLREEGLDFKALLIGDGPLAEKLAPLAKSLQDSGHMDRMGFVNQSAMPRILGSAEVLVFTSERDQYGLIATEAAACGCALVVADKIGCVGLLGSAQPKKNTLVYSCGDVGALTNCMRNFIQDKVMLKSMQIESKKIAKSHDIHCAVEIIENLILKEKVWVR